MTVRMASKALLGGLAAVAWLAWGTPARAADADEGLDLALKIEAAIANVAEKASESVVVITNLQKPQMRQAQEIPPEFRRFFGIPNNPPQRDPRGQRDDRPRPAGMGSGVLIRSDGYVVTNYHVIDNHDFLIVKLLDGRVFDSSKDESEVKVVGADKETDLAVLKLGGGDDAKFPHMAFGDSSKLRIGQFAIAVGAPFSLDYSVTIGHISQKGRHGMRMTNFEDYIQTDASINPGNSGGPLLNIRGEMIGINQFIMTGGSMSRGNIGLGFAIPSSLVERVTQDLIDHGEVRRPFLGISMQELNPLLKKRYGVESGVLVENVLEGEAAEKAGLKAGDVVTHVGDKAVNSPHDLLFAVLDYKPGDEVPVTVNRDGKVKTFEVIASTRSGDIADAEGQDGSSVHGLGLRLQPTDDGLVVAGIDNGSPAAHADPELQLGDVILLVNHTKVASVGDVAKALKNTKNGVVVLYIDRPQVGKYLIAIPLEDGK